MGSTIIHKGVKLDNLIQIAHNCEVGENTVIAAQSGIAGSSKVGKNCQFAGQTGIAGHLTIGDRVTIGAQSGVLKSHESDTTIWGTPAINIKEQMKSTIIFRNLPKLKDDLFQVKKEVNKLKNP